MKVMLCALAALAVFAGPASAQYYSNPYQQQQPSSGHSYDYQSGNSYNWRRDSQGNTTVHGYNSNTGSTWTNRIQSNGNQSGTDSSGNYWNYNARSGSYYNSNGTSCYGTGAYRTCTGGR